ncbi:MAG: hypothetical protein WHT27_07340 [candidate division WOR-3 bacterium]
MSLIQNDGFYFLQVVNDFLKVNLNQLQFFFEKRSIKAKFYVVLPLEFKTQLEYSIEIVKENIGDFAKYIGICFARKGKVAIYYEPLVKEISIEKKYNTEEFLNEISERFLIQEKVKSYLEAKIEHNRSVKFKRIKGNPSLHYEVWLKSVNKREKGRKIEIGFHIELGKPKQKDTSLRKRRNILKRLINKIYKLQYKNDNSIFINKKWGKRGKYWAKLYYETISKKRDEFNESEVKSVLTKLNSLFESLNDELEKANWGRSHEYD